jgi:hypothetical protein
LAVNPEKTMKTDVLKRTRQVLGIPEEPVSRPLVRTEAAAVPAARLPDKEQIAEVLERSRRVLSGPPAPSAPLPQDVTRRVEIMVTGSVSRVAVVRNALLDLQSQLFRQAGDNNLELRVTAFLDGCRHTTPWSRSSINAGNSTTRWHCFQGETRYAEALAYSADESDPIDAIVVFGNRFDDNLPHVLGIADRLQKRGTRIYAFHLGGRGHSRRAYEQLAACTGGAFVQLTDQQAFARVMPVIAAYVLRPVEALQTLPSPRDVDTKALVDRLKQLPPPDPNLLRLTGRTS